MGLKCGIVGLPNVGKSTLFNALSSGKAQSANFPFCTIEPNIGVVNVPDERLIAIAEKINPKSVTPTTLEIIDIAGLVKGASRGEGLGNQFLSNIRTTDAIIHVIRCFDDENIVHVDGSVDPVRDKQIIDTELQLKDLETIEKAISKIEKIATHGDKKARYKYELLSYLRDHIAQGMPARTAQLDENQLNLIKDLSLLTLKPVLYVCNVDEKSVLTGNAYVEALKAEIATEKGPEGRIPEILIISAAIEAEIATLDSYEERIEFIRDLGLQEPGIARLIKSAYRLLDLITFFTAGPKEVRAWTVKRNTRAPQAAGTIHSDFERGFIRAEVIKYEDFLKYGSEQACREAGKIHIEGKDYVVEDGDIIHFRFNV